MLGFAAIGELAIGEPADLTVRGTIAVTKAPASAALTGIEITGAGTSAALLGAATAAALGAEVFKGSVAVTKGAFGISLTGILEFEGSQSSTLGAASATLTGREVFRATVGAIAPRASANITGGSRSDGIQSIRQSLAPGDLIELFELDLSPIGVGDIYYFSPTNNNGEDIQWNSNTYIYAAIELSGVDWNLNGDQAQPKLLLPNGSKFTSALVIAYRDLVGARVTRTRTFRQFLDGEDLEDQESVLSRDTFIIEQKTNLNRIYGEFALRPLYSMDNRYIPNRVCLKNICTHRYRLWNSETSSFDYTKATCPYVGSAKFKKDGTPTSLGAEDACGKRLDDCINRFGNDPLPTRAMPGMTRIKV